MELTKKLKITTALYRAAVFFEWLNFIIIVVYNLPITQNTIADTTLEKFITTFVIRTTSENKIPVITGVFIHYLLPIITIIFMILVKQGLKKDTDMFVPAKEMDRVNTKAIVYLSLFLLMCLSSNFQFATASKLSVIGTPLLILLLCMLFFNKNKYRKKARYLLSALASPAPAPMTAPAPTPTPFPTAPVSAQGNVCPHCGHSNPASSKFCEECGSPMTQTEAPRSHFCTQCGHQNPAGAKFCEECGAPIVH